MGGKKVIIILAVVGLLIVCAFLIFAGPGQQTSQYDRCVQNCISAAREANIDRDDITDEQFSQFMNAQRNKICPEKCERYK